MFVKPAPGRTVPDPERGGLLSAEGRTVDPTQYWLRRVDDNDVLVDELAADTVQTSAQVKTTKPKA